MFTLAVNLLLILPHYRNIRFALNSVYIFVSYKDRTSTSDLLAKTGLLSVNQLAPSIKLCEVWKSGNIVNYPVQLEPNNSGPIYTERNVRPTTSRKWNQDANSTAAKECFSRNAAKIWNYFERHTFDVL